MSRSSTCHFRFDFVRFLEETGLLAAVRDVGSLPRRTPPRPSSQRRRLVHRANRCHRLPQVDPASLWTTTSEDLRVPRCRNDCHRYKPSPNSNPRKNATPVPSVHGELLPKVAGDSFDYTFVCCIHCLLIFGVWSAVPTHRKGRNERPGINQMQRSRLDGQQKIFRGKSAVPYSDFGAVRSVQ
jgi:hypothetical protein